MEEWVHVMPLTITTEDFLVAFGNSTPAHLCKFIIYIKRSQHGVSLFGTWVKLPYETDQEHDK